MTPTCHAMQTKNNTPAPKGYRWLARFESDGSISTGSKANDGRPFEVVRQCTPEEADANEYGVIPLWIVRFTDGGMEHFTAWDDEIMEPIL